MTAGTNTAGGFTVPEIWANEILQIDPGTSLAFDRVRQITMASDKQYYPVKDQTVTPSGGSSAFNAGVAVAVVAENAAPGAETKPAFKQLQLDAVKVLAYTEITNDLIDLSAVAVQEIVQSDLRQAIVDFVDYQVMNGTDLTGIIGHASTIKVPRNTADQFKLADAAKMYARLAPGSKRNAVWGIHPYHMESLINLADTSGRLKWIENANGALVPYLFGLPVIESQFLPGMGDEGDVCLVDLNKYILGVNKQITFGSSEHMKFTTDVTVLKAVMRLAGKPTLTAPVKLADGTLTVSPFVVLDDATS